MSAAARCGDLVLLEALERALEVAELDDRTRAAGRPRACCLVRCPAPTGGNPARAPCRAAAHARRARPAPRRPRAGPLAREWSRRQLERLPLVDAVALHQNPLGALDHTAPLERALELLDLLVQPAGLAVPAHGDLDRPLDRLRVHRLHVRGDPALGRSREEVDVGIGQLRDHGAGRELDGLADQRQRVLVVVVDDHDRNLRVLTRDQLDRLATDTANGVTSWPSSREHGVQPAQRLLVLVGDQHPKVRLSDGTSGLLRTSSERLHWSGRGLETRRSPHAPHTPAHPVTRTGKGLESIDHQADHGASSGGYPPSSDDRAARSREDRRLLERYHRHGDRAAREALVQRFLPLARQLARRYQRGSEPLDDLIQVASLGLLKAIDRFEPERPTAFSSFAVPTILGELKRHFRDKGWSVRVPRDLQELAVRVDRVGEELARALGPRADAERDRRAASASTAEQVLEAREAAGAYRAISLDRPRDDDEDGERHRRLDGHRGPRLRPRRGRRDGRAPDARADRARARGAAPALRGGPHAVRDRRPRRRLADARLAPDPPVGRAPARGGRGRARRDGPRGATGTIAAMEHWDLRTLDVEPHQPRILHSARGEARSIAINLPAGEALQEHQVHERAYSWSSTARSRSPTAGSRSPATPGSPRCSIRTSATRYGRPDARLLLLLAPWPGDGHPGARD